MSKPNRRSADPQRQAPAPASAPAGASSPGSSSVPLALRWFLSRVTRQATSMGRHVQKLLNHQRDILAPQAVTNIQNAINELRQAVASGADKPTLEKQMENVGTTAEKWLKPYPHPGWRENIEVLLVALTVAMGIRTFFLQPFKIPTGSMQPTLYGVTSENLKDNPGFQFPAGWDAVRQWFEGVSYVHKVAAADGEVQQIGEPFRILIFNIWQTLVVGGRSYTIWFPPDYGNQKLGDRAGVHIGQFFRKGEDIVKLRVQAGDHLFVDRLTYNFRVPKRGEIIVFETRGIEGLPQDQFYIKRLVGLGGETLALNQDYVVEGVPGGGTVPVGNLVVNGQPLSASDRHFENLYSFFGANGKTKTLTYQENEYFGHAMIGHLAPGREYHVAPNHFFAMGDNTMNSLDSRYWGDFPQNQCIGKAFFVYWPITERFGWGYR